MEFDEIGDAERELGNRFPGSGAMPRCTAGSIAQPQPRDWKVQYERGQRERSEVMPANNFIAWCGSNDGIITWEVHCPPHRR
jgi:hypothetical protein